jgi:hypothetical protein
MIRGRKPCERTLRPGQLALVASLTILLTAGSIRTQTVQCGELQRLIKETYNFKPARLSEAERTTKSNALDRVWNLVETKRSELLPCLRAALADPNADGFFGFDGSNLLMSLDPSRESKTILIHSYALVDLGDVDLRVWVNRLVSSGVEGFDVSEPADKWLRYPQAMYFLPEHGAYKVTADNGAMFLYGSMDEAQATPALLRIVSDKGHPGREIALLALMNQATPESLQALKQIKAAEFSGETRSSLKALLTRPELFQARAKPKTSRQEFVTAFEKILAGDSRPFLELVSAVPDGEKDVVAVLTPEDLPLVRKVRRRIIAGGNQHSIEYYNSFSKILMTLVWKPGLVQ